ncbi:MAG TPA: hypothetical protein VIM69_07895 [Opitutaceae bacterium]
MKPTTIFANASSRLHADLIVIRLKRSGIPCEQISVIYPTDLVPNSALCWLEGKSAPANYEGEMVAVAGPMRKVLSVKNEVSLIQSLSKMGLPGESAAACAEHLSQGEIVIGVNTTNEDEVSTVWDTLCDARADSIAVAVAARPVKTSTAKWFSRNRSKGARAQTVSVMPDFAPAY